MSDLNITLAAARVNAGMTQKEAAKRMEVSNNTIINWETGKITPRFAQLEMLCRIYHISSDNIFFPKNIT